MTTAEHPNTSGGPGLSREDPFLGSQATNRPPAAPPMPLGDGAYYQPGNYYTHGTPYVDARGQPVHRRRVATAGSMPALMREMAALGEWHEAYRQGPDALTELEAARQRRRLGETGVALAFKDSDVCGGGQRLDACPTARALMPAAREASQAQRPALGEGVTWHTRPNLNQRCGACALACQAAYQTREGIPTGMVRLSTTKPIEDVTTVIDVHL